MKADPRKVKAVKIERNLPCVLSDPERLDYGRKLADLNYALDDIERERKAAADTFKDQISTTDAAIRKFTTAIRDGIERRMVDCEWVYHWDSFTKQLVRGDTFEVIESAVIEPDERQMELNGSDDHAK